MWAWGYAALSRERELSYESTRSFIDWRSCTQHVNDRNTNEGRPSLVCEDESPILLTELERICLNLALSGYEC